MSEGFRWWLVLQLVALVLLPLCLVFFRRLPDRGYALSKPFGLLLLGFTFWLLNSARILPNSPRGIIVALVLLGAVSGAFLYDRRDDVIPWVREHLAYIAGVEAMLLVVFAVAVWMRSQVGSITLTEQPMDLMFLNAVTQADHFPPRDPWLSGYDVSYYYFGYLIVGMVGQLAQVPTEIGYNIGFAMIATLTLVGAFGIVYNLVRVHEAPRNGGDVQRAAAPSWDSLRGVAERLSRSKAVIFGLAGALMLAVAGNLVFALHFASAYGIGSEGFYDWIDVAGLTAGEPRDSWYPSDFFAFFNPSRIYLLDPSDTPGSDGFRAITEFPMFSFVLGDLHPHVMALPFVLLAVAAALTLYRSDEPLDITFWLKRPLLLVMTAIMVGGLAFLNTWDIATLAFVVVGAAALSNFLRVRRFTQDLAIQVVSFAVPLLLLAALLYIPFYAGFTSQADGISPVVVNDEITVAATRPVHAFLFWGPLFVIVVPFVLARIAAQKERVTRRAIAWSMLPALAVVAQWALLFLVEQATGGETRQGTGGLGTQIGERGWAWVTAAVVGGALAAAVLALWLELTAGDDREERRSVVFVLGLATTAFLLVIGCEFFYVEDVFNSRMNTVFKLYYQAWVLLALSSGFALYYLASRWRVAVPREPAYRFAWGGAAAVMLAAAALYPIGGSFNRTEGFESGELRGLHHLPPDELEAIAWLEGQAKGQDLVIAEAVGNDYSLAGRISGSTGIPAILGWGGHEDQWRGGTPEARAGRFEDVSELYNTASMDRVREIVDKYGVSYIYVGGLERSTYPAGIAKFESLPVAFTSGAVTIYRATGGTGEEVQGAR